MLTVLIVLVGLSVLILGHEAGHFFAAKFFGLKVQEFGIGFPPKMISKRKGETDYSVNWLPFGGFVRIAGENDRIQKGNEWLASLPENERARLFIFQPVWKRSVILLAGVVMNFILGWFLVAFIFYVGTPKMLVVTDIQGSSPAAHAGIRPDDVIEKYGIGNELRIGTSAEFVKFINENRGHEITLQMKRGSETISLDIVPRVTTLPHEGALGVQLTDAGLERHGIFSSLYLGLVQSVRIIGLTFIGFWGLVKDLFIHGSLSADVVGPVGIIRVAHETGQIGMIYLLQLIGLISLNLAAINLIPFPALDGGRFFMILFEKLKGSPISIKAEQITNSAGFLILVILILILTIRDIARWL